MVKKQPSLVILGNFGGTINQAPCPGVSGMADIVTLPAEIQRLIFGYLAEDERLESALALRLVSKRLKVSKLHKNYCLCDLNPDTFLYCNRWKLGARNAGIRFDADSDLDGLQLHRYVQLLPGIQTLNLLKSSKVRIAFYNRPQIIEEKKENFSLLLRRYLLIFLLHQSVDYCGRYSNTLCSE